MRLFEWLKQFKTPVYCEDCIHCIPDDGKATIFDEDGPMCKAHPITVDCSEKDSYVRRQKRINIVHSYKRCKNIRKRKSMPLIYSQTCWKFDKKHLTSESETV